MFLKRIELSGFKSFADKTELEFVRGITAVVGPNGSGKSNISDGIRWVLGEQSAKSLRGGKMEDVIFAGSDARKAVNFGEVSLTLDNTERALPLDFTEVTVTRRVHRSGDSEYFINKQPCRLRDITELFMDTGIGKEAYSIIGQGRIEEILSTKSEDRRGIFEEASGIVKYKSRKREAEKKLADTEQNLLRLHDLISELEDQIEPLRKQSEKAVNYKELKETLKKSEIALYVHQIEQLHQAWSEANEKTAALQLEQAGVAAVVGKHDAQLETQRQGTRRMDEELERLREALLTVSEEFEKCEGQGEVLKERQKNLSVNREQMAESIAAQETRFTERSASLTAAERKVETVSVQLEEEQARLRAEEERLLGVTGGISSEAEERLKAELLEVLNEAAQARNEIRYSEQQAEAISRRSERVDDERSKWTSQKERLESRGVELRRLLEEAAQAIADVRERNLALSQAVQAKRALLDEVQSTVRRWEQKLDTLRSRRDTMHELQNDYDGFAFGVKEVLKAKNRPDGLRGIHGAVAELVKVPAEVEVAIETALGAALQNIVVTTESDGREAIAFLKRRQLGRATFLPLDVIRGRSIPESDRSAIRQLGGFVGVAAELVQFDDTYRQIIGSLLGSVIVAKSLEEANRIAARCQYRYRVVTLEGDIVNPGGSMTGGSLNKKSANLLGRQRQIEELDKEVRESDKQVAMLLQKVGQLKKELEADNHKLEEQRQEGEQKRIAEQQYAAELNPIEQEKKQVEEQLALYSSDRESLADEVRTLVAARKAAEERLEKLQLREQELQQAIRDAELVRKASESAKEELQSYLTEIKVKIASYAQEKQSLLEQLERQREDCEALRRDLEQNRRLLRQTERDLEASVSEGVAQLELLNELKLRKQKLTEDTEFKRAERAEWIRRLELEEDKTREQRNELKRIEDLLHQTEVRVNRLDVELENVLKKLAEEYELSFELAKERYPVPEDVPAVQNEVRELKRKIAALGTVNLGAIEEFARVSERYEFLSEQKNDLMEAKASIYQVIREMDIEMSRRFRSTFEAIRDHFTVVFVKLFGGGRADLILSEPDNPLETGIEIVAQPPGKKLQNLQLLSGGERALTAIALLFAILHVKPVPFCVLDEVEAALDDANVSRYAEYLREFSSATQFIVVTHRKGTMEEADVLYGVTMQEGGVSKLVSVRLEDVEPVSA